MAVQIGNLTLHNRYILAPMAGITNSPFRELMTVLGAGAVVSELISATGMQYEGKKTLSLCRFTETERPVGLQIFGDQPEHMITAAQDLERKGVDFVDINLGCPVPKVVGKGGGAAMLRNPVKLFDLLSQIKQSIKIPLTIKIRTGWDSCSVNALENIHAASEAGVTWVAIHGRTRAQGYEGLADWDLIADIKSKAPLPIIGNGDILTAHQAVHRLKESGCDAVMIGRGALRNPFLFREIAHLEGRVTGGEDWDYWKLVDFHLQLLRGQFAEFYVGVQLRKFMTWYSAGIEGASQFRKELYSLPNDLVGTEQVIALGKTFFDRPEVKKQQSFLKEPFLQGGHG